MNEQDAAIAESQCAPGSTGTRIMPVYHGTVLDALDLAREKGLQPRGPRPSNWSEEESRPDLVYLTSTYPFFFARRAGHRRIVALEIDLERLDKTLLLPDEDFIAQTKKIDPEPGKTVHATVRANLEAFRNEWEVSLQTLGTCCYQGVIPPQAFTRCCILDMGLRPQLWHALFFVDNISMEYHAQFGKWHGECLAWAFGSSDRLPRGAQANPSDRSGLEVITLASS
jgi:hypothetical protein